MRPRLGAIRDYWTAILCLGSRPINPISWCRRCPEIFDTKMVLSSIPDRMAAVSVFRMAARQRSIFRALTRLGTLAGEVRISRICMPVFNVPPDSLLPISVGVSISTKVACRVPVLSCARLADTLVPVARITIDTSGANQLRSKRHPDPLQTRQNLLSGRSSMAVVPESSWQSPLPP
jgi:hypothetical protein